MYDAIIVVFLVVHLREATNKADDEKEWAQEVEERIEEMQEEAQRDFDRAMAEYATNMEKWRVWKETKVHITPHLHCVAMTLCVVFVPVFCIFYVDMR